MTSKERLIEILNVPIYPRVGADLTEVVADYLLDNDVIPVVRCKDCMHSYETILGPGCEPLCGLVCTKGVCVDCIVPKDFFCPYGERNDEVNE